MLILCFSWPALGSYEQRVSAACRPPSSSIAASRKAFVRACRHGIETEVGRGTIDVRRAFSDPDKCPASRPGGHDAASDRLRNRLRCCPNGDFQLFGDLALRQSSRSPWRSAPRAISFSNASTSAKYFGLFVSARVGRQLMRSPVRRAARDLYWLYGKIVADLKVPVDEGTGPSLARTAI